MVDKKVLHDGSKEILVSDVDDLLSRFSSSRDYLAEFEIDFADRWDKPFRYCLTVEKIEEVKRFSNFFSSWAYQYPQDHPMRFLAARMEAIVAELTSLKHMLGVLSQASTVAFVLSHHIDDEELSPEIDKVQREFKRIGHQRIANLGIPVGKAIRELLMKVPHELDPHSNDSWDEGKRRL